jgi:hypothetical protein
MMKKVLSAILLVFCFFTVCSITACSNDDYAKHVLALQGYPKPHTWYEPPAPPVTPPPAPAPVFTQRILDEKDMIVPEMPPPPPPPRHRKKPKPDLLDAS